MKNKKSISGFTLIEAITASIILLIIVITMYSLILETESTQVTEENKMDMNQAARAIDIILCDNIRNAGSVLTLLRTPPFLNATPPFTGMYPLNNDDYPDGIILTSGDQDAVTEISGGAFTPGDGVVNLQGSVNNLDNNGTVWAKNDAGIIINTAGYYVFRITGDVNINDTTLTVRATPVYYSGLLNVPGKYVDNTATLLGQAGNVGTYSDGSIVIRLNYFNIFTVKNETDGTKTLTLTTDTEGVANILADGMETAARAVPIIPNIEDVQFEYITKDDPAEFWASTSLSGTSYADPCATPGSADCTNFINNFVNRNIASIRVYALLKTEDKHKRKHSESGVTGPPYDKPRMGDVAAVTLGPGRFHYTYLTYEVFIRNYDIVY
ncbi:MAG: type II secretion system protein [Acidobacteriota bacterium]